MKRFLILFVSLFIYSTCYSQNTFPQNGNVGIGTTNPQFRLHMLGGHSDTNFSLQYDNGDPTRQANLTLWASEPGWTYTGTGIGNNVFNSSTGSAGIVRINNLKGGSYIRLLEQELRFNLVNLNGVDMTAMYINPSGNMGLGTLNTNRRLSVAHETGYGQIARFSSNLEDEEVGIGTENTGFSWIGTTSNHNFQIYANNSPKISVLANGAVGIGTSTPNEKLAVNGNIRAREVKVENANWPDYVFAKDYQLPTLQETEKHIKEKGHLPGIPSAREVKANGIDLGEMNAKMLQKIEELTLHLIRQQKEIEQLRILAETESYIKEKGHFPGIPSAVEVESNGVDLGEMNAKLLRKIEELTLHLIENGKQI